MSSVQLRRWTLNQRARGVAGSLSRRQKQMLDMVGFVWSKWDVMLYQLKLYKKAYVFTRFRSSLYLCFISLESSRLSSYVARNLKPSAKISYHESMPAAPLRLPRCIFGHALIQSLHPQARAYQCARVESFESIPRAVVHEPEVNGSQGVATQEETAGTAKARVCI
jgi:hypothetical protein